jgi:hypothetical protein
MDRTRLRMAALVVISGVVTAHVSAQSPPLCGGADPDCGDQTRSVIDPADLPVTPFNSTDVVWGELANPPQANEILTLPRAIPPDDCTSPTLVKAEVQVSLTVQGDLLFENLNNNSINDAGVTFNSTVRLVSPILPGGFVEANLAPVLLAVGSLPAFDGTLDFGGTSGVTQFEGPFTLNVPCLTFTVSNPAALAAFQAGPVVIQHSANSNSTANGTGNIQGGTNFTALLEAQVRYVYCCGEVVDGCPCLRDPRSPASLLIYPEFCNRLGNNTLVTITNANCYGCTDGAALPTEVVAHFLIIDKDTCLEENFDVPLTPCDTYTFLTKSKTNRQQGYLYAYAVQGGVPVAFNHLLGQEVVLDGFANLDWSVNAVGFQSAPGLAEGAPTNVDHDSVRDLDNHEYIEAPDKILVPRFLGQDENPFFGNFKSTVTLINLSGGKAFSTIVEFLVYNDSEECFSQGFQFNCWDKRYLADLDLSPGAGVFGEAFLDATSDVPEIIGWTDLFGNKKAGWFTVEGKTASSGIENITDPAIYAVLVEEASGKRAADLPWEIGCRNGDLLPIGPLGDPIVGNAPGTSTDNQ